MNLKTNIDLLNVDREYFNVYEKMRHFGWNTKGFGLDNDIYNHPPEVTKTILKTLSYLIFLDSLQVNSLPHLGFYIKDKYKNGALTLALSEHVAQEALHVQSYNYIVSVYPEELKRKIYSAVEKDENLNERAKIISKPYQDFIDNPTKENYILALFADYLLEGLLFFNGFMPFYQLIEYFPNTQTIISLIHRDENIHTLLFQTIISRILKSDKSISKQKLVDYSYSVMEPEIKFNTDLMGEHISEENISNHTKYLLNLRLSALNLEKKSKSENPLKYLYNRSNFEEKITAKTNVMEVKSSSYGVTVDGWNDF